MRNDLYIKGVLSLIAVLLIVLVIQFSLIFQVLDGQEVVIKTNPLDVNIAEAGGKKVFVGMMDSTMVNTGIPVRIVGIKD